MELVVAHICLASITVGLLALVSRALLPRLQAKPGTGYWLVLGAIAIGLLSSGTQIALQGRGLPSGLPMAQRMLQVGQDLGQSPIFGQKQEAEPRVVTESAESAPWNMQDLAVLNAMLSERALVETTDGVQTVPAAAVHGSAPVDRNWFPWIAGTYFAGLLIAVVQLLRQAIHSWRLLQQSRMVTDKFVRRVWHSIPDRSQRIRLREVPGLDLPACTGLIRRTILLPPAHRLPREENALRCILTHELVHLQRGDTWGLMLQETFRVLFWFHPAAWWLSNQLELMRELSCDQLVVKKTKLRKGYAEALLQCAAGLENGGGDRSAAHNSLALVPLTRSQTQLRRRIEMLFSPNSTRSGRSHWLTVGMAGSAAGVLCFTQVALAAGFKSPVAGHEPVVVNVQPVAGDELDRHVDKLVQQVQSGKLEVAELKRHVNHIVRAALEEESDLDSETREAIIQGTGEVTDAVAEMISELQLHTGGLRESLSGMNLKEALHGHGDGFTIQVEDGEIPQLDELLAKYGHGGQNMKELMSMANKVSKMAQQADWEGFAKQMEGLDLEQHTIHLEQLGSLAEQFDVEQFKAEMMGDLFGKGGLAELLEEVGSTKGHRMHMTDHHGSGQATHAPALRERHESIPQLEGKLQRHSRHDMDQGDIRKLVEQALSEAGVSGQSFGGKGSKHSVELSEFIEKAKALEALEESGVDGFQILRSPEFGNLMKHAKGKLVEGLHGHSGDAPKQRIHETRQRKPNGASPLEARVEELEKQVQQRMAELKELKAQLRNDRRRF
ncbi:MAG: hypothetical protein ACI9F9_000331 [Candidatus Paceibacteria bacterium]|jgi:hypothetical protein